MIDGTIRRFEISDNLSGAIVNIVNAITTSFSDTIDNVLVETVRNVYIGEYGPFDEHVNIVLNKEWILAAITEKLERDVKDMKETVTYD